MLLKYVEQEKSLKKPSELNDFKPVCEGNFGTISNK